MPDRFPLPNRVESCDILRDGGSYRLLYSDSSGELHSLRLPVRVKAGVGRVGFDPPVVHPYKSEDETSLTWDEAEVMGELLSPLIHDSLTYDGPRRARELVHLLCMRGDLPPRTM